MKLIHYSLILSFVLTQASFGAGAAEDSKPLGSASGASGASEASTMAPKPSSATHASSYLKSRAELDREMGFWRGPGERLIPLNREDPLAAARETLKNDIERVRQKIKEEEQERDVVYQPVETGGGVLFFLPKEFEKHTDEVGLRKMEMEIFSELAQSSTARKTLEKDIERGRKKILAQSSTAQEKPLAQEKPTKPQERDGLSEMHARLIE